MRKRLFALGAAALACALLWLSGPRPALLDNGGGQGSGGSLEIRDSQVPMAEEPNQDGEEPFSQFTQEQREVLNEVLELVNQARSKAGVPALELDPALCGAAQIRAAECVDTFSHTRPDGTSYQTAMEEAGISFVWSGENAATGQTTAQKVMESWLGSEGHRANILNEKYTRLGAGFEQNTGNRYRGFAWVQLFSD